MAVPMTFRAKSVLDSRGAATRVEVAQALGISANYANALLNVLAKQGFAKRTFRSGCNRYVFVPIHH